MLSAKCARVRVDISSECYYVPKTGHEPTCGERTEHCFAPRHAGPKRTVWAPAGHGRAALEPTMSRPRAQPSPGSQAPGSPRQPGHSGQPDRPGRLARSAKPGAAVGTRMEMTRTSSMPRRSRPARPPAVQASSRRRKLTRWTPSWRASMRRWQSRHQPLSLSALPARPQPSRRHGLSRRRPHPGRISRRRTRPPPTSRPTRRHPAR